MNQYFMQSITNFDVQDSSIAEFQKRTLAIRFAQEAKSLSEELEQCIDLCTETRCNDDLPFYYQFNAYCYLFLGKSPEAEKYGMMAIDNFRVCGMAWNEGISHWFLGLIYRVSGRGYLYMSELTKALNILDPVCVEYSIEGKYEIAAKCEAIRKELEEEKVFATKLGTGPLRLPDEKEHGPDEKKQNTERKKFGGYIVLPWFPIYQSVRGGPKGVVWVDPPPERMTTVTEIEFDNTPHALFAIKKTAVSDLQITLTKGFEYGWTKVIGHSMSGAHPLSINEGDYVLFYKSTQPSDHDIVIASWPTAPGNLAYMVKRYNMAGRLLISEPADFANTSDYSPIHMSEDHQILGVVIAVAKPLSS